MNDETHESCKATFNSFNVLRGSQEFEVFFVNENALVACFDSGIDEALVKGLAGIEPLRVVYIAITALPLIRPRSIEATLSGRIYARLILCWQQLGYQVKLFFLRLDSPELAAARIQQRAKTGDHNIPNLVIYIDVLKRVWILWERYTSHW